MAIYLGGQIALPLLGGLLDFLRRLDQGVFGTAGAFLRAHPGVISAIRVVQENLYPDRPSVPFDRNWLLMVGSNASIALLLSCLVFRTREVPYGAD